MEERMDRRIARLALARFRVGGFAGTSIADLAGALGISKAASIPSWTPSTPASRITTPRPPQPGPRDSCWTATWPS
jgi:hypothetical protein